MYKKVDTGLDFVARENDILKFWKENRIFEKTTEDTDGKPIFTIYDGPPTANGKPHIGHILTRVMKDIIPRYKQMKGYAVFRKAGWDTHGLPVELEVERLLGIDGKKEIEKYGIEPFIKKCKESVWNIRANGSACPTGWATGWIWNTLTSLTRTITSSRSGGALNRFSKKACFTKASR